MNLRMMNSWLNSPAGWGWRSNTRMQGQTARRGGVRGGKGNRVQKHLLVKTCYICEIALSSPRGRHEDTARWKHSEWCGIYKKKGKKDLGDVWWAMTSYRPTHYIVGSPAPHRVYHLFEWIHIAQGWNDFKHQLSIESTKQLKSLKSLRTHENPNPVHFLCLTSAAVFFFF